GAVPGPLPGDFRRGALGRAVPARRPPARPRSAAQLARAVPAAPGRGAVGRPRRDRVRTGEIAMIRVVLPYHLRVLAQTNGEVQLAVEGPVTQRSVLDALESRYPMLRGTVRDQVTQQR